MADIEHDRIPLRPSDDRQPIVAQPGSFLQALLDEGFVPANVGARTLRPGVDGPRLTRSVPVGEEAGMRVTGGMYGDAAPDTVVVDEVGTTAKSDAPRDGIYADMFGRRQKCIVETKARRVHCFFPDGCWTVADFQTFRNWGLTLVKAYD